MLRPALIACLPWFALLVALVAVLWLLVKYCRPPISWQRLTTLHRNETGGVQSLSFVATLPVFVMVMMLIVQVSQVMIANLVVQYAAFAAARSAMVWLPARVSWDPQPAEIENSIGVPPVMTFDRYDYDNQGPGWYAGLEYAVWLIQPAPFPPDGTDGSDRSAKLYRIHRAAALACMPIAPSRDAGGAAASTPLIDSASRAYLAVSPGSASNQRVPARIANKLTYSLQNTKIELRRTAPRESKPWWDSLGRYEWAPSWHDQLTLTVTHQYALLPGPARLLARSVVRGGQDSVSGKIDTSGTFYTIPITATATLPNEGETSRWRYVYNKADVVD
ncbi:MAG TPA: TadE family protein [Pirellulaceae bacterium]|nr:TadE family protein [Pirellulaceae bacterium]